MHRPTLRIATPIFADDGKLFGIFMINVDMRRAFDRVRSSVLPGETIYVVNKQGDYLIHPDRSREFGALLGKKRTGKPTSRIWRRRPGHARQRGYSSDQAARPGGIALAPALLAGVEWVGVIETAPNAVIMARPQASEILPSLAGSRCCARQCWPADREVADPPDRAADRSRAGSGQ